MVKHSFLKWLTIFMGMGLVVSVGCLFAESFVTEDCRYQLYRTREMIWPSSVFLMATEGIERTAKGYWFVFLSVVANMLLYGVLGALLWCLSRLLFISKKKSKA